MYVPDQRMVLDSVNHVVPDKAYCEVCSADFAPLVCNEFCQQVGAGEKGFERREAIELTRHFCAWLAREGMTCAIVELI